MEPFQGVTDLAYSQDSAVSSDVLKTCLNHYLLHDDLLDVSQGHQYSAQRGILVASSDGHRNRMSKTRVIGTTLSAIASAEKELNRTFPTSFPAGCLPTMDGHWVAWWCSPCSTAETRGRPGTRSSEITPQGGGRGWKVSRNRLSVLHRCCPSQSLEQVIIIASIMTREAPQANLPWCCGIMKRAVPAVLRMTLSSG